MILVHASSESNAQGAPPATPEPGLYRHFRGGEYELLDIARHSETEELLVVYRSADSAERDQIWVRPLNMFVEPVLHEHRQVPRFVQISGRRRNGPLAPAVTLVRGVAATVARRLPPSAGGRRHATKHRAHRRSGRHVSSPSN
jgi:hypothetical protein